MNRTYRLVFNAARGMLQVASELTRAHGKKPGERTCLASTPSRKRRSRWATANIALALGVALPLLAPSAAQADLSGTNSGNRDISGQSILSGYTWNNSS